MAVEIISGTDPQSGESIEGKVVFLNSAGSGRTARVRCDREFSTCFLRADRKPADPKSAFLVGGPSCLAVNRGASGKVIYGQVYCGKHPQVEPLIEN